MWQYKISVIWKEAKKGGLHSEGKSPIPVGTPREFGGSPDIWSPEDLLISSVAACIMTSVLFFVEKDDGHMRSYKSRATGTMEKTAEGLTFTHIDVQINVVVDDAEQEEVIRRAVAKAEKTCPISKSLRCTVAVKLNVDHDKEE